MNNLPFRKITLADKEEIQSYTFKSYSRNCDLNFMNLCSWQFLYNTEFAVAHGWLVFRFYADGHLAYMLPCQKRDPHDILQLILEDSRRLERPFLMLGVCENFIPLIDNAMPGVFHFSHDRDYTDYIYDRDAPPWPRLPANGCKPSATTQTALQRLTPTTNTANSHPTLYHCAGSLKQNGRLRNLTTTPRQHTRTSCAL